MFLLRSPLDLGFCRQTLLIRSLAAAASRASRRDFRRAVFSAMATPAASYSAMTASTCRAFFLNFDSAASSNRLAFVIGFFLHCRSGCVPFHFPHRVMHADKTWTRTSFAPLKLRDAPFPVNEAASRPGRKTAQNSMRTGRKCLNLLAFETSSAPATETGRGLSCSFASTSVVKACGSVAISARQLADCRPTTFRTFDRKQCRTLSFGLR